MSDTPEPMPLRFVIGIVEPEVEYDEDGEEKEPAENRAPRQWAVRFARSLPASGERDAILLAREQLLLTVAALDRRLAMKNRCEGSETVLVNLDGDETEVPCGACAATFPARHGSYGIFSCAAEIPEHERVGPTDAT